MQISEAAHCTYSLSPTSASYLAPGGSGNFSVTTGSTCPWTASTVSSWLHTTNSGTGNGTVNYSVDANGSASLRSGTITAGGQTFAVSQAGVPPTLASALDTTNLLWVTDTNYPWQVINNITHDGVDAAASGNKFIASSTSWVQTTVVGPGTIGFWWKVDSDVTISGDFVSFDDLEFVINGAQQDQIMGQIDWNYREFPVPAGTNTLTWQYVKDDQFNSGNDSGWLDQVTWSPGQPIALATALDTCGAQWDSGGTIPTYWTGQTNVTHDGKSAARSGTIYLNQETWMQTVVSGVSNVSFWWKVSSQTNFDFLEFYTNDVLARRISGEVNWQSNFFKLPATNTVSLKWRYAMTNGIFAAQGQEAAWVDQVIFSPSNSVAPVVSLLGSNPVVVECHGTFTDPGATAQDGCSGAALGVVTNGSVNPNLTGAYTIQYVATDPSGNSATNTRTVNVVDTTSPVIMYSFTNLSLSANSNCQASLPDLTGTNYFVAIDNCSSVTVTQMPPAGSLLPKGTNQVVLTAFDSSGNAASSTNSVTIVDTTAPALVAPADVVVSADPGQCSATNVALGAPTVIDNCDQALATNNAPQVFPVGTNIVIWTATDGQGNTTNATQLVIVNDAELPSIACPATVTVSTDAGQTYASGVNLGTPVTSDNCGVAAVTNDAPAHFPMGTNTVTWTVTDIHGNLRTCAEQVIVTGPEFSQRITGIVNNGDGTFTISFSGIPNSNYVVEVSATLLDWQPVQTNTAGDDGTWSYTDHDAPTFPARSYRSVRP